MSRIWCVNDGLQKYFTKAKGLEAQTDQLLPQVDMGNHDKAYQFSHYTERFRNMPVSDWGEPVETFNGPAPNNW